MTYIDKLSVATHGRLLLLLLFIAMSSSACVSVPDKVEPLDSPKAKYLSDEREVQLIDDTHRMHEALVNKGVVLENESYSRYLEHLVQELVPPSITQKIKIKPYIVVSPSENAFALPNGNIYITVGLLSKFENESQLAFVMAHEIAHIVNRDSLRESYNISSKTSASHVADLFLFGTGVAYSSYAKDIFSFSRETEMSADTAAVRYLSHSPFDLSQSVSALQLLKDKYADGEKKEDSDYSTHPELGARIRNVQALLKSENVGTANTGGSEILNKIKYDSGLQLLSLLSTTKLYIHTVLAADKLLKEWQNDNSFLFYEAEGYRGVATDKKAVVIELVNYFHKKKINAVLPIKNGDDYATIAKDIYNGFLTSEKLAAQSYRGLGLLAYAEKKYDSARQLLSKYLQLKNKAKDRKYIQYILNNIEKIEKEKQI